MVKIVPKTAEEIVIMAEGGKKLGTVLETILAKVAPGVSTLEIDSWIDAEISRLGGEPSFKKVPHYHWASCIGLNSEVVHSIPRPEKIVKARDLLKIDLGMLWQGFNTDLSWTVEVTRTGVRSDNQPFLAAGERALAEAIATAQVGNRIGDISRKIQTVIEEAGYHPVRVLTGHGIGRKLHEEPLIPGVVIRPTKETPEIVSGTTLAIEVIYNEGEGEVVLENDGWTISTKDGKISGLFEKTIAVTENGPLVLTPVRFSKTGH